MSETPDGADKVIEEIRETIRQVPREQLDAFLCELSDAAQDLMSTDAVTRANAEWNAKAARDGIRSLFAALQGLPKEASGGAPKEQA